MIIACPACNTRYVVPDKAIGVEGRTVRCAKCRHSWFQDGASVDEVVAGVTAQATERTPKPVPPSPPAPGAEAAGPADGASATETDRGTGSDGSANSGPADVAEDVAVDRAEPPAVEEDLPPPPSYSNGVVDTEPTIPAGYDENDSDYDEPSQFGYEPPFRGRRNPLKVWTAAAAIFAVLAFATIAAVSFWGVPDWAPIQRPTFGLQEPDLQLEFPAEQQDRRTLANGAEYFGASGTVTNTGRETREVPPILIVLRDTRDRIVYSWEVTPPKTTLAPGESVRINEAVTDVPRSAAIAEIGWKPG